MYIIPSQNSESFFAKGSQTALKSVKLSQIAALGAKLYVKADCARLSAKQCQRAEFCAKWH